MAFRRLCAIGVVAIGAVSPAFGQTSGTVVEGGKTLLSSEKQSVVRAHVLRTKQPAHEVGSMTVGAIVAPEVELIALPEDTVTEVPMITSYMFAVEPNGIAVVDPETRQVIQLIAR